MSKVSITLCDGCGKELTGKPFAPDLALIVTLAKAKMTEHFCYQCATPLIEMMNKMAEERFKNLGGEQDG